MFCMATEPNTRVVVIVMGVSGSGKTTVGRLLASACGWAFVDADDFHLPANIAKMKRAIGLTAADRKPWIDAVIAHLNAATSSRVVLACSALTHDIRERFRTETRARVVFAYLRVERAVLHERLLQRTGHFAHADLLASQLATLEEPKHAITIDVAADDTPERVSERLREALAGL